MILRHWLIRFFTPLVWRLFPDRKRDALQEFSMIEKDSGCQLLSAMDHVHDPKLQAIFFQQVLEEFHHADLFDRACTAYSDAPLDIPVITRDELIDPAGGPKAVLDLVSYVHVGESAVNDDFGAYTRAPIDTRIRGVFKAASEDEAGHVESSRELLTELASGDDRKVRRALFMSRVKRGWRSYVRSMRHIGEWPLAILLSVLYFLAGPLVIMPLRRRLDLPRQQQLQILSSQLRSLWNSSAS